ncbi:MAG: hypothetical protein J5840_04625 [Lachnospiraceae bacterium]|nr:hypothetical protein [Lachnospiraceae bacterium]
MKNRINKELISNIEISEEMKNALYKDCIKGRRTSDFTFRYSTALSIAIIVAVFGFVSIGASAAIIGVKARLEGMSEEEYAGYEYEVDNDTFISVDEGESRELTDAEIRKIIELERDYYDKNVFPENEMAHLKSRSELSDDQLAYVEEDNLVYLPEKDMDDEQILEYIDHNAKKRYVNIQGLKAEGIEPGVGMALESTPIEAGSAESKAKDAAEKLIKEFYGEKTDDSWIVLVGYFEPETEEDTAVYSLNFFRPGIGYATDYTIRLKAEDLSPVLINQNGYLIDKDAKHYSLEEAESKAAEGEEEMEKILAKHFGFGEPDSVTHYTDSYAEEDNTTAFIDYEFVYGDTTVYLLYRIEDGRLISFSKR